MEHQTGRRPRVVLTGPPGSGKTTVGTELARRLGVPLRDTDADVEGLAGRTVAEIFVDEGEPRFRELERAAVRAALTEHEGVLALGGGAVLDPTTQDALVAYARDGGVVVFLDVSLSQAAPRVGLSTARPLLLGNPRAQWQTLMTARRPTYERLATVRVLTDGLRPEEVADQVVQAMEARGARTGGGDEER